MSGWFRMYEGVLDDPKIQRLPAETFKGWVNLLCLTKRHDGVLPPLADVAFALRLSEQAARKLLDSLQDAGLIDETEAGLEPHNWNGRQYKSDVSNERVKRYRERQGNGKCNVTVTPDATPPETEQRQNRTEPEADAAQKRAKRKTQLHEETLPDEWRAYCTFRRPELNPETTFENFRDFYLSHGRAMQDWSRTWQRWVRNENAKPQHRTSQTALPESRLERSDRKIRDALAAIEAQESHDCAVGETVSDLRQSVGIYFR